MINFQFSDNRRGFTLIEMLIVMGIIAILIGFSAVSVGRISRRANLTSTMSVLLNDFKAQQLQAMSGVSHSALPFSSDRFGIHFDVNKYTIFQGTYLAGDANNLIISLNQNLVFDAATFLLPSSEVVFEATNGEVVGYSGTNHSIVLKNVISNEVKTLQFNKFGVVTSLQ